MSGYIVFFDFETGGLEASKPEIQIAAVAVDPQFKEVDVFESKIAFDPDTADAVALEMNHYTAEAWAGAPVADVVVGRFARFVEKYRSVEMVSKKSGKPYQVARLGGHNAVTFDAPRLRRMFDNAGQFAPFHPIPLDTLQLAMWKIQFEAKKPANLQLSTLCEFFGVEVTGAHDALVDVRLTAALCKAIVRKQENA